MNKNSRDQQSWFTPQQVAEQFGINVSKVLAWINRGELRAVNVADRLGRRPRWRVSPVSLEEFVKSRENHPQVESIRSCRNRYVPGRGGVVSDSDGRLAKNIPHEVRVKRIAAIIANRRLGYGADWRPFVEESISRYAQRVGVTVEADAVLALEPPSEA